VQLGARLSPGNYQITRQLGLSHVLGRVAGGHQQHLSARHLAAPGMVAFAIEMNGRQTNEGLFHAFQDLPEPHPNNIRRIVGRELVLARPVCRPSARNA
jgi:hypothetical protein